MRNHLITLRVAEEQLPLVLDVVRGTAEVLSVAVDTVKRRSSSKTYATGKANKGISGPELILNTLRSSGPRTENDLQRIFVDRGFAPSSHRSNLSMLKSAGSVERLSDGRWAIKPAPHVNGSATK